MCQFDFYSNQCDISWNVASRHRKRPEIRPSDGQKHLRTSVITLHIQTVDHLSKHHFVIFLNIPFSRMQIHEFRDRIWPWVNFPKLALLSGQLKIPKQMSFQIQVRKNEYKNHKNKPLEFAFLVADNSLPYIFNSNRFLHFLVNLRLYSKNFQNFHFQV